MALRLEVLSALCGALLAIPVWATSPEHSVQDTADGALSDRLAFQAFVDSRPTPDEFQQAYPDVWLILPGDIVSREVCSQYYRYLAELDAEGRITGGTLE